MNITKKWPIFVLFIGLILPFTHLFAQKVPSSERSRKAIQKVAPRLKKELAEAGLQYGAAIYIRVFKEEKELELWVRKKDHFVLFKTYPICTYGFGSLGPKLRQGDGQAPEGFYFVKPNQLNPLSKFYLAFNIGYPNRYDRLHKRTGSAIMVHGNCVSIGCFAMTDKKIEKIYAMADAALRNGQSFFQIHIFPFRMTKANMEKHKSSEWYSFWQNLKEGYQLFEIYGNLPAKVGVKNGRYVFGRPN